MNNEQFKEITNRLDMLTRAFAFFVVKDEKERKKQIWLLKAIGLSNSEIAAFFNTSPDAIRATLSQVRTEKS
ncbi:MAG: hypothetical protein GPJ52_00035 [Candidatus Heimdallarchaeota archaeon]|nr:hypothetical protein [Candidatus Heimdallarchaeota archaeon]